MKIAKKSKIIYALIFCCLLSGCATSKGVLYTDKKYSPKPRSAEILLTTKDLSGRPYEEIGMIEARSEASGGALRNELKNRARKMGADAVIKIQYNIAQKQVGVGIGTPYYSQALLTSIQETVARGIAVVFIE